MAFPACKEQRPVTRSQPAGEPASFATEIPIVGMTCRACELRIQKHVGRLPGVAKVEASASRASVRIQSTRRLSMGVVAGAIDAAGYEIGRTPWLARDRVAWLEAGISLWIVIALVFLAQLTGLFEIAARVGDLSSGGLLVALLLGLAAGVSTCAVLVGGLVLALSAGFQAQRAAHHGDGAADPSGVAQMRPAFVFVLGRIVGYGLFGAALGALGAGVALPPMATAALMIAVAVLMTLLGTRLTGLSPRLAGWSPTLPMGLGRRLGLSTDEGVSRYSDARAALLGAASFFLPCGFTQAVQVYALSTGSPLLGGALLAVFAIGTAPGLLGLAGLPVMVSGASKPTVLRFVGVIVLAFAVVNVNGGLQLAGVGLPWSDGAAGAARAVPAVANAKAQTLKTTQGANGYAPTNVTIASGTPTTWVIESTSATSCATSLVVPSLGIQKSLKLGQNTIDLPPMAAGVLRYSCSMGMYSGTITVVDRAG
jgi:sulfite exporter TauE/SafE/copper chaperone CopZ